MDISVVDISAPDGLIEAVSDHAGAQLKSRVLTPLENPLLSSSSQADVSSPKMLSRQTSVATVCCDGLTWVRTFCTDMPCARLHGPYLSSHQSIDD